MKKKSLLLLFLLLFSALALSACMDDDEYYDDYDDAEYSENYDDEEYADDYDDEAYSDDYDDSEDSDEYADDEDSDMESASPSVTVQGDFAQGLSSFVTETMENENLPGAAVAIVQGDEIIFAEGFGYRDVDAGLPVTTDTLFHIGSTNKSMTAMLTAILVDEGYFDWDTPVVEIYPDFELSDPASTESVTMRDLLSMQSGIPDSAEDDLEADQAEDVFDHAANAELLGAPGDEFSYSNISASLAGYVDVVAAGYDNGGLYDGYVELLTEKVLDPIGMDSAVLRVSDARRNPNYGKSYYGDGSEAESEDIDGDPLAPSGSVKASILDMAAYISTQLNEGVAPNGTRVASAANLRETWKPLLENYGMGWETSEYNGYTVISHEGSFDNYLSVIGIVPDLEIGFVVLTNCEENAEGLIIDLPQYVIDELGQ